MRPLLAVALCAVACASAPPREYESVSAMRGDMSLPMPVDLDLPSPFGDAVNPRDLRGRVVLLAFVNTDDINCQALARPLETLAARYDDDLAVVLVAGDASEGLAARTLLEAWRDVTGLRHARYALATDAVRAGESPVGAIAHVPTLVLLNRAGAITRRVEGFQSVSQLEALVAPAHPREAHADR